MDDLAWGALTLSLTILGGIAAWVTWQRRGVASGLRVLAFALLPLAAYLTRTLRMFTRIADAIASWATSLVFSPTVWLGLVVAGVSVALFVVSGAMRGRQAVEQPKARSPRAVSARTSGDPEIDEIEAMLRKRGDQLSVADAHPDAHPGAAAVLALAASRPAAGAGGRLICVDGPAGSGKTTLAAALARASGAQVVHVDDVLDGWDGLPGLGARLAALVRPWVAGVDSRYERYDWHAGRFAQTVPVPAAPLLVVEGVGSGQTSYADLVTVLVWVSAPPDLRLARGLERDGAAMALRWRQWQLDEAAHFARERTAERADVTISG